MTRLPPERTADLALEVNRLRAEVDRLFAQLAAWEAPPTLAEIDAATKPYLSAPGSTTILWHAQRAEAIKAVSG